jgi:hypothetical protein
VALREIIKVRTDYWPMVLGLVLLTLVLVLPGGIVGFVAEKGHTLLSAGKGEGRRP